jgi:hypothetical protein
MEFHVQENVLHCPFVDIWMVVYTLTIVQWSSQTCIYHFPTGTLYRDHVQSFSQGEAKTKVCLIKFRPPKMIP